MVLFADDTKMASKYSANRIDGHKKWFDDNRLSLNLSKTKFIIGKVKRKLKLGLIMRK